MKKLLLIVLVLLLSNTALAATGKSYRYRKDPMSSTARYGHIKRFGNRNRIAKRIQPTKPYYVRGRKYVEARRFGNRHRLEKRHVTRRKCRDKR